MRFEHDNSAIEWTKQELGEFSGGLRQVLSDMDLEGCKAFSFFPAIPAEVDLKRYGAPCVDADRARQWSAHGFREQNEFINAFLSRGSRNIALFQANYFRVNRPEIRLAEGENIILVQREPRTTTGSLIEGWEYLDEPQKDLSNISRMVSRGMSEHGVGLLTTIPPHSSRLENTQLIDRRLVDALVERAEYIIVDAYSGGALIFVDLARRHVPI